jgi:hypothetical protein
MNTTLRTGLSALSALFWVSVASAAEIFEGHFFTVPEKIFVTQAFEIHFELAVSPGCEIEDVRISDFPNDASVFSIGQLESVSRNRTDRNGQAVDVLHFKAAARALRPIEHTFSPALQCMLVERRTSGFFSHWQSFSAQKTLAPFALRIQPLPTDGRPGDFSGAVGLFRLAGHLSQTAVHPGDIVTFTLELAGQGWLGTAFLPTPAFSSAFKTYPAKETLREPLRLKTEQVLIPTTTNAVEIAALRFSFFNPATERYETSVTGPFRLSFTDSAAPKADEVRVINTSDPAGGNAVAQKGFSLERGDLSLRQAAPLIAVCTAVVVGLLLFLTLFGRHTRMAFLMAAVSLGLGIAAAHGLSRRATAGTLALAHRVEARFAPSQASAALFALNPGTAVIPVEKAGAWTRVDADGRRGWIPSAALKAAPKN